MPYSDAVRTYLGKIEGNLKAGNATEHTHRAALAELIESLAPGIRATNEPRRSDFGAIDYVVSRDHQGLALPIGYIEAKDVGKDLRREEVSEQMQRYRRSLSNLILTDYVEFRWYLDGELRDSTTLATRDRDGRLSLDRVGVGAVQDLLATFLAQAPPRTSSPQELAVRMAELTHTLRDHVIRALGHEGVEGDLNAQHEAFQRTLLPDLKPDEFADMYAQTVAYGLFSARAESPFSPSFSRTSASRLLPRTNPFLRRFFNEIAGPDLDERVAWIVDALAALLSAADIGEVLRDFGRRTRQEDPVVHFYETFLAKYDPRTREMRGVYYTPEPVVSYIVRSVDRLIRTQLGRSRGLADENTVILDPALGTGTFLYEVVNQIFEGFSGSNNLGAWPGYVEEKLLRRIFGFEILMAPYAIAHLKLGLLLRHTGYAARNPDERLGLYLTNTLAEGVDRPRIPFAGYISDEANAATGVKRDKPIEVVIGNPPYSGHSANRSKDDQGRDTWIGGLIRDYYRVDGQPLGERNPKMLQDDYVKFIRFGQWRIDQTGRGILAFISNNGYLDNPTFRGMRQSLMNTFSRIYILDLHGNSRKRERTPEGGPDENVFDIMQGVAIALFVKEPGVSGPAKVYHADLWGEREGKYKTLLESDVNTVAWSELTPKPPSYLFKPQSTDLLAEYECFWKVTEAIPVNATGITTHRDNFVLGFDEAELRTRIAHFLDPNLSDGFVKGRYLLPSDRLSVSTARKAIWDDGDVELAFIKCLYRPFDVRPLFYHDAVIERSRREVMRHVLTGENLGLITTRQTKETFGVLCSQLIVGHKSVAAYDRNYLFPLYLYPEPGQKYQRSDAIEAARKAIRGREGLEAKEMYARLQEVADLVRRLYPEEEYERWPNLAPGFIAEIELRMGLSWVPDGVGDLQNSFGPEDVFHYMYAVLHSPTYRSRYAPFLKSDFPRVPITSDVALFRDLARLGATLVNLHLLRAPELVESPVSFPEPGTNEVDRVRYDEQGESVFVNRTQHFANVPPTVWQLHVGGYQVAEKWLKDRKGRRLSYDDIEHYRRVVMALERTIHLMSEIDACIPSWPVE